MENKTVRFVEIQDIKVIHSKDLVLYILENGEIITYSLDDDSSILNHEKVIVTKGTDENEYSPVYNYDWEMLGFKII